MAASQPKQVVNYEGLRDCIENLEKRGKTSPDQVIAKALMTDTRLSLTDYQLRVVMNAARLVPVEKRDTFLQRIAAMLALRGRGRFTDTDVADVAQLAMAGLIQQADVA